MEKEVRALFTWFRLVICFLALAKRDREEFKTILIGEMVRKDLEIKQK